MNPVIRISLLFVIAIATFSAVSAKTLPEGKWEMVSYNFQQKIAYPLDDKTVTLNIAADGKIGGSSGCNTYGGSYAFEDGKLKISDIFSTMMACDEMTMSFERTFHDTLMAASEFKLEGDLLTITDAKTKSFIRFKGIRSEDEIPRHKC